jgi:hypothetical protein
MPTSGWIPPTCRGDGVYENAQRLIDILAGLSYMAAVYVPGEMPF